LIATFRAGILLYDLCFSFLAFLIVGVILLAMFLDTDENG
jgi:hypothetical protein